MKTKILIGGGSGLVGSRLLARLDRSKFEVRVLTRSLENKSNEFLAWNLSSGKIDLQGYSPDIVINLAGAGVADRLWTKRRKEEIISSRVKSNALLVQEVLNGGIQPKVFMTASAIGIYARKSRSHIKT